MRKFIFYFAIISVLIANSCTKELEKLLTKMSCNINGTEWSSSIRDTKLQDNKFIITGTSLDGQIINITIFGTTEGTYDLIAIVSTEFTAIYKESASVSTNDIYTAVSGTVVLTDVDTSDKKISGTFNFIATNLNLQTKTITSGKFDDLSYNE
jgi:hypothetical protein